MEVAGARTFYKFINKNNCNQGTQSFLIAVILYNKILYYVIYVLIDNRIVLIYFYSPVKREYFNFIISNRIHF